LLEEVIKELDLEEFTRQLNEASRHNRRDGNGDRASTDGRGPTFGRWLPREWKPVYSEIVLLSCAGWKGTDLAEKYNYTEVHISNILRTPQAGLLRKRVLEELQGRALESIPAKLEQIAEKTVDRLRQVVNDDALFEKSPFGVIDRGLKVLTGVGHLKNEDQRGGMHIKNAVVLTKEHSSDLIDGLKRAKEAKLLNPSPSEKNVESYEEPYIDQEALDMLGEE